MSLPATLTSPAPSKCPISRIKNWMSRVLLKANPSTPPTAKCPLGFDQPSNSVFVAKAAQEAAQAPVIPGDPAANRLLQEAREAIYHWPPHFPGFCCQLILEEEHQAWNGHLRAAHSRDYDLQLQGFSKPAWLRFHIEEFLAHREHPSVSRMASPTGVEFGDDHRVWGQRIDFLGDKMGSWYRILNRKLTMIGRNYGEHSFVITIDDHLECKPGTFAATHYTAYYRDQKTNRIKRVEAFHDSYVQVGTEFLPSSRRYVETSDDGMISRCIHFRDHQLLS
ncbi:MAG: DUF3386 family protein [Verrucomicrobiia bacterium]